VRTGALACPDRRGAVLHWMIRTSHGSIESPRVILRRGRSIPRRAADGSATSSRAPSPHDQPVFPALVPLVLAGRASADVTQRTESTRSSPSVRRRQSRRACARRDALHHFGISGPGGARCVGHWIAAQPAPSPRIVAGRDFESLETASSASASQSARNRGELSARAACRKLLSSDILSKLRRMSGAA